MNSLIIPVYKNEENIPDLLEALISLNKQVSNLEVVFIVDGSPDASASLLTELLPATELSAQLLLLSKNFGSFSAIRVGLQASRGELFAVMSADLQEPLDLVSTFFTILENEPIDIVIGTRESRSDQFLSRLTSKIFWVFYKKFVVPDMPVGGVDMFGCNRLFRDHLLQLNESHSSLVALLFWMGFRRKIISYARLPRLHGKSAWTYTKKIRYLKDNIFSFTDTPIILLTWAGVCGIFVSILLAIIVIYSKLTSQITVPGYTATILTVIFFGAINLLGLGIIGTYAWRTYENTKQRPSAIIMSRNEFCGEEKQSKQEKS